MSSAPFAASLAPQVLPRLFGTPRLSRAFLEGFLMPIANSFHTSKKKSSMVWPRAPPANANSQNWANSLILCDGPPFKTPE
eukprot:63044-Rhodomonas_salina.1